MLDKTGVAIYCRLALKDRQIMKQQKAEMLAYAKGQGYENISVYSDNGYSGTNFIRPAFMRMENDIAAGKIGLVISKNISRIGRDYIGVATWFDRIEQDGISFISVSDGITSPFVTAIENTIQQAFQKYCAQQR